MIKPEVPINEIERQEALMQYSILDTLPEQAYDDITYLASQICNTPISLISLLDDKRQWFKSHHGLKATSTPKDIAFCAHAINNQNKIMIVPDSREDGRFYDNPLVTNDPYVIFYAGIPLVTTKGYSLGTLCVIDNKPNKLNNTQQKALKALANQVMKLFELRKQTIDLEIITKNLTQSNHNIQNSIQYASLIQNAVLPKEEVFKQCFSEHFIFYKPRDLVSGDFYWIKEFGKRVVIATADCTGHGVPGAFMSMLGISILNEIVTNRNAIRPATILEELRLKVKRTLNQKGHKEEVKDGMDISLCCLDKEKMDVYFAGARNDLYVITETIFVNDKTKYPTIKFISEYEMHSLFRVSVDNQPIGVFQKEQPFTESKFKVNKGDKIYMSSDGYLDQFGGVESKKFNLPNFENLLLTNHNKPFQKQKEIFELTFKNWKNENQQLDDVLVLGVKV